MSIFWPRKRSSCWPFPRISILVSSTLCRSVSLIPGAGLRFPFLSSRASWLLGLRALLYRPYQTREIIAMGDCYVLCGRSGVTLTALLHTVRVASGCLSPQGVVNSFIITNPTLAGDHNYASYSLVSIRKIVFWLKQNFIVLLFLLCCWLTPKLGETAKVYRIDCVHQIQVQY